MAEARRAADRDEALKTKVKEPPMKVWNGEKVTYAKDVSNAMVQDQHEIVVIGADVEALYPSLLDIEIANICYNTIMKSNISYNNINYRKALLYLAITMNKTDQRTSPLWRVLPRRTSRGGVRPGVTASPETEDHWYFPPRELTNLEKRMVVAMVVKVGVLVMMSTHVYSWNGEAFLQKAGGPIGLRSTCAVARVVMNEWDSRWMELCKLNNIKLRRRNRYMDDIRAFLNALKMGWRWVGGHLCYTESWEKEDRESGLSATRRTALILVAMMNDIFHFLNFTIELGEDFVDGKLPSLDINIWVVNGRFIFYEYFEKTMASNLMVEAKSALSREVKLATLTEEIARRLRNTSLRVDSARRLEILERACTKMKTSGHTEAFIRQAVEQGIKSFDNKVKRSLMDPDNPSFQPLFPKAGWRKDQKSRAKALKRATWFRGVKDESEGSWNPLPLSRAGGRVGKRKKVFRKAGSSKSGLKTGNTTVVFVPSTRGGILIQSLKDEEERMAEITGFRVKYQEAGGSILANAFNTNLGSGQTCGRAECPPCKESGGKVDCKAKSIVYESRCLVCNPRTSLEEADDPQANQPSGSSTTPREGIYVGESSRSLHERSVEHIRDAKSFSAKSHIVKHWMTSHPSLHSPPKMGFTITGRFKDCLSRQISEALRISMSRDALLNSKGEYGHNSVSRLTVSEDMWERKERDRREEEQEEVDKKLVEAFRLQKCSQYIPSSTTTPPTPSNTMPSIEPYLAGRGSVNTLTGTVCNIVEAQMDENAIEKVEDKDNITEDPASPGQTTTTGNGPSKGPRVTLGQSNRSPCAPLVYTKGGDRGQDEHPWMKRVPEGVDESGGGLVGGGRDGDDAGVAQDVDDDDGGVAHVIYETDEDEFQGGEDIGPAVETLYTAMKQENEPVEKKNTAQRNMVSRRKRVLDYDLSYFNLWWARMAVEGRREAKESKKKDDEIRKRRMKFRNIRRLTKVKDDHQEELAQACPRSGNVSQSQQTWRGGLSLNGGNLVEGEGEGVWVPADIATFEQPQDSVQQEKLKNGTHGLSFSPIDFK